MLPFVTHLPTSSDYGIAASDLDSAKSTQYISRIQQPDTSNDGNTDTVSEKKLRPATNSPYSALLHRAANTCLDTDVFAAIKGWFGEKGAQFGMWLGLDSNVYQRVHDLVIPCQGGTTQIDHVLVSVFGIFVVETKNMNGWIFGDEQSPQWTQCIFGKKFRFQNPTRQNYRHVKALAEYLQIPDEATRSVVFFIGDCEFKTPMPPNVLTHGLCRYVQSFHKQVFSPEQAEEISARLLQAKLSPAATRSLHVTGLKERHSGDTCPKCESALVLRTARRGTNSGGSFYGCSGYPKCRYTRTA